MKVLTVIDSVFAGGAETSLATITPHLVERGIDMAVAVFHLRDGDLRPAFDACGVPVIDAGAPTRLGRIRRLRAVIRDVRPDLVHTTLYEADIAGRLAAASLRVPVVSSVVNDAYGPEHRAAYGAAKVTMAQALDVATAPLVRCFHANSRHLVEVMSKRLLVPRRKFVVIHRGRDRATLGEWSPERRARVRRSLGIGDATPVVLAVGRQEVQKGFDVLLRAAPLLWKEVPDALILIAGREGGATEQLRAMAAASDARVRFLGHRTDVADLMVASDVLAFPSNREGFPGTLVEAMALGLPVVASDLPQNREAVGPLGSVVQVGHPGGLARALTAALANTDDQRTRHHACYERFALHFGITVIADATASLYGSLATSARPRDLPLDHSPSEGHSCCGRRTSA